MSIKAMNYVWEHSPQKGSSLLLLLAIADFADDDGRAFPGVDRLAKKTRMGKRNTQYLIKKLVESGELIVDSNKGIETGQGKTNLYQIALDSRGANFAPLNSQGVQNGVQGVQGVAPDPSVRSISINKGEDNTVFKDFINSLKSEIQPKVRAIPLTAQIKFVELRDACMILTAPQADQEWLTIRQKRAVDRAAGECGLTRVEIQARV